MREPMVGLFALAAWLGQLTAQAPDARLEGRVLDPLSQPVANATVTIEADGDVIATTRSDGEGTFVVGRLPRRTLVVRATTGAPDVGATDIDLAEHARPFVFVRTMPARRLTGVVTDAAGATVADAWVAVAPVGHGAALAAGSHTATDAQGRFVLAAVPFGTNTLRVWAEGFAGAAHELDGNDARDVPVTLSRDDPCEHSFELLDATAAQLAAAQITVRAWNQATELPLPPALRRPVRGDDSRWWLRGWPDVDALHARLQVPDACIEPPELRVAADSVRHKHLFYVEDAEDALLRGRLVGLDGSAVAAVRLSVRPHAPTSPPYEWTDVTTDDQGTFALQSPVSAGRSLELRCRERGGRLRLPQSEGGSFGDAVVCKFRRLAVLDLELAAAGTVTAVVNSEDGRPLRGASFQLVGEGNEQAVQTDVRGFVFRGMIGEQRVSGWADADGRLRLPRAALMPKQTWLLQVASPDGYLEHTLLVEDPATCELGVLRAAAPVALHGIVHTADGAPAAGARLTLEASLRAPIVSPIATDRHGRFFATGLRPGPCVVFTQPRTFVAIDLVRDGDNLVELRLP